MTKIKAFIKLIIFTAGLILINDRLTEIFAVKEFDPIIPNVNSMIDKNWLATMRGGFYSEKKNSMDVVFVGSSQIFCDFNPNVIWKELGITSYDFSAHRQDPGTSYYYLKQMFETQSPKVVVIDLYLFGDDYLDCTDLKAGHYNFDYMKKDLYRIQGIWNRVGDTRLETLFPIMYYNQRWKEITMEDILFKPVQHDFLKGTFLYMNENQWSGGFRGMPEDLPDYKLPEQGITWLHKIMELCEKHNCECLFIKTPLTLYGFDHFSNMQDIDFYAYIQALTKYCEDNNIPFMNMIGMEDEIGLDWYTDYNDSVHLNWNGQQKMSVFMGKYLMDKYHLESKKGLPGYEQWDEDYEKMRYYTDNFQDLYQNPYEL